MVIYEKLGLFYEETKDFPNAISNYDKAISNYDNAISNFSKTIEFRPFNANAWIYRSRGECYKAVGDNKKAQTDFVRAKQLGWVN